MPKFAFLCSFFLGLFSNAYSQSEEKHVVNAVGSTNTVGSTVFITSFGETIVGDNGNVSSGFLYAFDTLYITAMATVSTQGQFEFYPNPAHDFVYIEAVSPITEILLTDLNGRVVKNDILVNRVELYRFDLANFSKGVYLLKVKTQAGVFAVKMVME